MKVIIRLGHPYLSLPKEEECFCGWGAVLETIRLEHPERFQWSGEGRGSRFLIIPTDKEDLASEVLHADRATDDYLDKIIRFNDKERLGFRAIATAMENLSE